MVISKGGGGVGRYVGLGTNGGYVGLGEDGDLFLAVCLLVVVVVWVVADVEPMSVLKMAPAATR